MATEDSLVISMVFIQTAVLLVAGYDSRFCHHRDTTLYADPDDCGAFYHCFVGSTFHNYCPSGLYFNPNVNVCDWPWSVNCRQKVQSTSLTVTPVVETSGTSTHEPTATTTTLQLNGQSSSSSLLPPVTTDTTKAVQTYAPLFGQFCSSKTDGLYADPDNCAGFYQCSRSFTYHFTCPEQLVYNPRLQFCDWPRNVDCIDSSDSLQSNTEGNTTGTTGTPGEPNNEQNNVTRSGNLNTTSAAACGRVVCYFPNWAVYRNGMGASFRPENVNPDLCTHIVYAFAKLEGNRLTAVELSDEARGSDIGNFARITSLKLRNPSLKVLLAVGGWNMGTSTFSRMAATVESRAEFINTTISFLRSRRFDGLDLDWEYPNSGNVPGGDRERYTRLCEELRAAFDQEESGDRRLLLTAAVAAGKYNIDTSYDVPRLAAVLDIINVMAYDLHGTWDGKVGHNSPLKAGSWERNTETYLNIEWVANYWVSIGANKNKLGIGIPLFAKTFTLLSSLQTEVGAPIARAGLPGKYTQQSGYLSYYEICALRNESRLYRIDDQRVPYLVSYDQWAGYDDPASVREKVQFILEKGFGGVMVWDLSMDDFSGRFCGEGPYPLLNAVVSQCALLVNG